MVKLYRHAAGLARRRRRRHRKGGIVATQLLASGTIHPSRDPRHLLVAAQALGVELHLPCEVARIQPRQARRKMPVSFTVQAMTGDAGRSCPCISPAQGDDLTSGFECAFARRQVGASRGRQSDRDKCLAQIGVRECHRAWEPSRPAQVPDQMRGFAFRIGVGAPRVACALALGCAVFTAACKPPPEARYHFDSPAIERGRIAIERVGCAACHTIPGIDWPKGRMARSLVGFDDVGVIAGSLPNTPANLAAFVRNAPAAKPGSTMPVMPLTPAESRDVAAYLLGAGDA